MSITRAEVNLSVDNNATWQDAFQFGTAGDTSWDFASKTFHLDVKASRDDAAALLSLTTANTRIVVDDTVNRVLHFNVTEADLVAGLSPALYQYDLVMIDIAGIRTVLMGGTVRVCQGVTRS